LIGHQFEENNRRGNTKGRDTLRTAKNMLPHQGLYSRRREFPSTNASNLRGRNIFGLFQKAEAPTKVYIIYLNIFISTGYFAIQLTASSQFDQRLFRDYQID
jgi:hypothetical protein